MPGFSRSARRFSPARLLLAVVLTIVVLYAAAIAYLMTQETRLVFQAGRPLGESRPTFPYTQVAIPRADGAAQFAWAMENPDARTWLLFLHGNSATIASRVNIARYRQLRALGLSVLAPEYRGFAGLAGRADRAGPVRRRAGGVRLPDRHAPRAADAHRDLRLVARLGGRGRPRRATSTRPRSSSKARPRRWSGLAPGATRCSPSG